MEFQSTLPARGATSTRCDTLTSASYFNPRSPHGERPIVTPAAAAQYQFQSTLPARGATASDYQFDYLDVISIHAPRTGSDRRKRASGAGLDISIHAPRTGSDRRKRRRGQRFFHFNPRSPHGERRTGAPSRLRRRYFNPRSPHGERQFGFGALNSFIISIHAPRTGSD